MAMWLSVLCGIVLTIALQLACCQNVDSGYPLDTLEPIVRVSPVRQGGVTGDRFGYSAVAHQIVETSDNDSYLTSLENTMIMVGAPNGVFPGGVTNIEPSGLACKDKYPSLSDSQLLELTKENITQSGCYDDTFVTGLVYTCPLSSPDCFGTIGNNDSTGPDGLLFDRVGNVERLNFFNNAEQTIHQNKTGQLMGSMLYSTNDYFVACAPLWEYDGPASASPSQSQPHGQCVYSPRSLSGFTIIQPCISGTSNNQNVESFCVLGSSIYISDNQSTFQFQSNPDPILAAGSPGRHYSSGGVYYFNQLNDLSNLDSDNEKPVYVPASHGDSPILRKDYLNVNKSKHQTYYGFAVTSGYMTSLSGKDFIVSSPRWDEENQLGRVFIVTEIDGLNATPSIFVEGEQFGEYFGGSIAVADLNGDGWDDLIVGAPIYSKSSMPDIGRICIFQNMNGMLNKSIIIEGYTMFGRFGSAITSLGDLNDDGYQDFAVSAPFEGSGVVYVYYGQEADSTGSIVNKQYAQRIDGGSFVNGVTNITEVSGFGFSLSGNVDVDNNRYNDLVIGAYESQSVFVLRSRPIANTNISIQMNSNAVSLISYQCTDYLGQPSSCFNVTVCVEYNGKSLDNGFATTYSLKENIVDSQQRIYFDDYTVSTVSRPIQFSAPNTETCDTATVYVLNSTISLGFSDFQMIADVNQIQKSIVPINEAVYVPSDISQFPLIASEPFSFIVPVDTQCGDDDICDLDLAVTYINTTYLGIDGEPFSEQSYLTLDAIARVDVYLSFINTGEDVFGYLIVFPLPRDIFIHRLVLPQSSFFTCNDTTPTNTTHANQICTNQQPFLSKSHGSTGIRFRWLVNNTLRGMADTVSIPVTIMADPSDSRNRENITNNNQFMIDINIKSQAVFKTTLQFTPSQVTYQGNGNYTENINDASGLGEELRLIATINNGGPSTIYNAKFVIYIPANTSETGNYYYFYPAAMTVTSGIINCMGTLNPSQFNNVTTTANNRRKRSLANRQEYSLFRTVLNRGIRQNTVNNTINYNLDCMETPEQCLKLVCNVSDIVGYASVDIYGFIDERFYNGKSDMYSLKAYATVDILDTFINTTGSVASTTDTLSLSKLLVSEEEQGIPWYYIAPPAIGGFLIIVILAIILYFVGFFSRKKRDGKSEDPGVDQFVDNPFGEVKPTSISTSAVL